MERVTVLYLNQPEGHFDLDYYTHKHMPMVCRFLANHLVRCEIAESLSAENGEAIVKVTASIYLDSNQAFKDMIAAHAQEVMGDVPNYTNIKPIIIYERCEAI